MCVLIGFPLSPAQLYIVHTYLYLHYTYALFSSDFRQCVELREVCSTYVSFGHVLFMMALLSRHVIHDRAFVSAALTFLGRTGLKALLISANDE